MSNEERITYVVQGLVDWRMALVTLREYANAEKTSIVSDWISRVDVLAGLLTEQQDGHGGIGKLLAQRYNYRGQDIFENKAGSLEEAVDSFNYMRMATQLSYSAYKKEPAASTLAAWWDQWAVHSNVLYYIKRYDDNLFSDSFKASFRALTGEVLLRRFELCSSYGIDSADLKELTNLEVALVNKATVAKLRIGELYLQKQPRKKPAAFYWLDKVSAIVEEVGKLAWPEVIRILDAKEKDLRDRALKYDEDYARDRDKLPSAYTGPKPKSPEELEKIVTTSESVAEVDAALNELGTIHHTFCGDWERRLTKMKKKK